MKLKVTVRDVFYQTVLDGDQRVEAKTSSQVFSSNREDAAYVIDVGNFSGGMISFYVSNGRFFDFEATFQVNKVNAPAPFFIWKKVSGGHAVAVELDALASPYTMVQVILSKVRRVDILGPNKQIAEPQMGSWYHKQTDDGGIFQKGTEMPLIKLKADVINKDRNSIGANRLEFEVISPVRPHGLSYVFEYKTTTAPKLVFVWHSQDLKFFEPSRGIDESKISYHLYFHPTPHDATHYPFGKNSVGRQPHVDLGYRHLMFESWGSVQHYYAKKKVVFVVPIGSVRDAFGECGSLAGIQTVLTELNAALQVQNVKDYGYVFDVGRVAVSGFSAGANFMLNSLMDESSPRAKSFLTNNIKEVYSWDGATGSPNGVPLNFAKFVSRWIRRGGNQKFMVYTANPKYVEELRSTIRSDFTTISGAGGASVSRFSGGGKLLGEVILLPDSFFRKEYKKSKDGHLENDPLEIYRKRIDEQADPGFPSYTDTHHWFFKVSMLHALLNSGFASL